jgi:endonuclease YncB( thermonuclease family)
LLGQIVPAILIIAGLAFAMSWLPAADNSAASGGRATIIDGDTIEIRGERIRLSGIDAPESAQLCRKADGAVWRCGQTAAMALAEHIGAATVSCIGNDHDRYGRRMAVCHAGGEDLNAQCMDGSTGAGDRLPALLARLCPGRRRRAGCAPWFVGWKV